MWYLANMTHPPKHRQNQAGARGHDTSKIFENLILLEFSIMMWQLVASFLQISCLFERNILHGVILNTPSNLLFTLTIVNK